MLDPKRLPHSTMSLMQWRVMMLSEAEFKRDLVRQLIKEGGYARRLEDRYAVGTLDLLLMTKQYLIYAEAKLIKGIVGLPARVSQREQIRLFNDVGNPHARAIVIGLKDGVVGFGLPGEEYDAHCIMPWPLLAHQTLTAHLDVAVEVIFSKELV
jgi:hypothetical protein